MAGSRRYTPSAPSHEHEGRSPPERDRSSRERAPDQARSVGKPTFSERFESRLERDGRTVIGPRPSPNELARVHVPGDTRKQHQRTTNDRSKLGHVVTERAPAILIG